MRILLSFLLLTILFSANAQRNILVNKFSDALLAQSMAKLPEWQAHQKAMYLNKIDALPDSIKNYLIKDAEKGLKYEWPTIPASLYLDYQFTGNRYNFERKNNERRKILNQLVIGALLTKDKKYIPQIVNGLWAVMEQSTWVLPAHVVVQKAKIGLPDPNEVIIDLGSGTTAAQIAAVQFMLKGELDNYAPVVNKRIDVELKKRIFDPYLQRNDYWWMGFQGQTVNNWNAWVNTNILQTALLSNLSSDSTMLVIKKAMLSTDKFINQYPEDGGCDEGPSYWGEAGGKLIRFVHLMNEFTNHQTNWANENVIHNMGSYIQKVHIADNNFVNFADAFGKLIPDPESVYRYGELFKDTALTQFSAYLFTLKKGRIDNDNVFDFLETASIFSSLTTVNPLAPLSLVSWLPNRQVLAVRSHSATTKGLFVAMQGGNNGESHNHNDVGNFILYANGNPVIVDAGVGSYTSQTFSSKRYELWNMQSQWHNTPTINGVMQKEGIAFKATNVQYKELADKSMLSMHIENAYPKEADVVSYVREFVLDHSKSEFKVTDSYQLLNVKDSTTMHFLCYAKPQVLAPGLIEFYDANNQLSLRMNYDPKSLNVTIAEKPLDDERIIGIWGKRLYRINMTNKALVKVSKELITFSLPD